MLPIIILLAVLTIAFFIARANRKAREAEARTIVTNDIRSVMASGAVADDDDRPFVTRPGYRVLRGPTGAACEPEPCLPATGPDNITIPLLLAAAVANQDDIAKKVEWEGRHILTPGPDAQDVPPSMDLPLERPDPTPACDCSTPSYDSGSPSCDSGSSSCDSGSSSCDSGGSCGGGDC